MTKVLVLGGTGFIGTRVAAGLQAAGFDVVCSAWTDDGMALLASRGQAALELDIRDPDAVAAATRDFDAVVNLAFASDDPVGAELKLAAALAKELAGTQKTLVWTSGVGVAGANSDRSVGEEAPLDLEGPVGWRAQGEQLVVDASAQGVRSVVIRPPLVYGHGHAAMVGLLGFAAQGDDAVPYPDSGTTEWATVHVDDLADLYVLAAQSASPGSVYIAASESYVTVKQIAEHASAAIGLDGRTVAMPVDELRTRIGPMADLIASPAAFSGQKARNDLGWQPAGPAFPG